MKYKFVIFDLDGTIMDKVEYIWKTLHEFFGIEEHPERKKHRDDYFSDKITYHEWATRDMKLMVKHGANEGTILRALSGARLMDGAMETFEALKKKGYRLAIISGSLSVLLDKFIPNHGDIFDYVFINRLHFDGKGEIMKMEATPFDMMHKKTGLLKICSLESISPKECVFVGDHDNDVQVSKIAGFSIAFDPKSDKLEEVADVVVKKKDLREILKYL